MASIGAVVDMETGTIVAYDFTDVDHLHPKLRKLYFALEPYLGYWNEWIATENCFLSDTELKSIQYYREYISHQPLAKELKITPSRVSAIYNKALRKLKNNHHIYRHWIANRIFIQAGVYKKLDKKGQFLMQPLHEHQMSKRLFNVLAPLGDNMFEILSNYTKSDLLKVRRFGQKNMKEMIALLVTNRCISMLK